MAKAALHAPATLPMPTLLAPLPTLRLLPKRTCHNPSPPPFLTRVARAQQPRGTRAPPRRTRRRRRSPPRPRTRSLRPSRPTPTPRRRQSPASPSRPRPHPVRGIRTAGRRGTLGQGSARVLGGGCWVDGCVASGRVGQAAGGCAGVAVTTNLGSVPQAGPPPAGPAPPTSPHHTQRPQRPPTMRAPSLPPRPPAAAKPAAGGKKGGKKGGGKEEDDPELAALLAELDAPKQPQAEGGCGHPGRWGRSWWCAWVAQQGGVRWALGGGGV